MNEFQRANLIVGAASGIAGVVLPRKKRRKLMLSVASVLAAKRSRGWRDSLLDKLVARTFAAKEFA
jgi:hypothetical protein